MKKFTASIGVPKKSETFLLLLIIGIGVLANADESYAMSIQTVYASAKDAITGIYGAMFTIASGILGIIDYFMSGKNIGHLLGFIVVGLAPHILIAFIEFAFPVAAGISGGH